LIIIGGRREWSQVKPFPAKRGGCYGKMRILWLVVLLPMGPLAILAEDILLSSNPDLLLSTANDYGKAGAPESLYSINNDYGPLGSPDVIDSVTNEYGTGLEIDLKTFDNKTTKALLSANPDLYMSTANDYGPAGAPESLYSINNDYGPNGAPEFLNSISNEYGAGIKVELKEFRIKNLLTPIDLTEP